MTKTVKELFLSEYFFIKTILGTCLNDEKKLFFSLSKLFLIDETEVERLYALAENEIASNINTENDFLTYQRVQKFLLFSNDNNEINSEYDKIAKIKGNAILSAKRNKLLSDTENTVYNSIMLSISEKRVDATRVMGILQCEGIFVSKNKTIGFNYLSKSAGWNDVISTLALLRYFNEKRAYNLQKLSQLVLGTPFEKLYVLAVETYGKLPHKKILETDFLESAFEMGTLRRDVIEPAYLRILESTALNVKEKEKILLSQNKEMLLTVIDLPIKLSKEKIVPFEARDGKRTVLQRNSEKENIERILKNSNLRGLPSFRPLCLCCDSKYVLKMYAKSFSYDSESTHVEVIDVSALTEYDLNPSHNNVFIRCIDETKDNRFLLFFGKNTPKTKIDNIKNILVSDSRAKFHLANPNVTLDLSAVLPICFADEITSQSLKEYCDVIKLEPLQEEEKIIALNDIIEEKAELYEIVKINVDKGTLNMLCQYDLDVIGDVIDSIVRLNRECGKELNVTQNLLTTYLSNLYSPKIGFGGKQ